MNKQFKFEPKGIKISKEYAIDILDELDFMLSEIAMRNYKEPKIPLDHVCYDDTADSYDLTHEIEGADYLIKSLQKIKKERQSELRTKIKNISKYLKK